MWSKQPKALKLTNFLGAVLCAALAVSCAKKETRAEADLDRAYRLIDEQKTDEAIRLLEGRQADGREYVVALASAFAHKGGIKIQKLVPLFNYASQVKKMSEFMPKMTQNPSRLDHLAVNLSALLIRFSYFLQLYAAIPVVSAEQAQDLKKAVRVLDTLGSSIQPADALYRAILRTVLFKFVLADEFYGDIDLSTSASCQVDNNAVARGTRTLGNMLIGIYADMGIANPDQAADLKRLSAETHMAVQQAQNPKWRSEGDNASVRQAIILVGFGRLLRCAP